MTPCTNAIGIAGQVLFVAGLAFGFIVFWQRKRLKRLALARAGKPTFTRKQFWTSLAVGAAAFSLLPSFFESCTGFHLPTTFSIRVGLAAFVAFAAFLTVMRFVFDKKYRALGPEASARVGFVLIGIAGGFFVLALWFYHLGHP
jgi:hypothetical protein